MPRFAHAGGLGRHRALGWFGGHRLCCFGLTPGPQPAEQGAALGRCLIRLEGGD
jgi:hypothetical protein